MHSIKYESVLQTVKNSVKGVSFRKAEFLKNGKENLFSIKQQ